VWAFQEVQRQFKVMRTAGAVMIALVLLFGWLLLFSRFRWRTRLLTLSALAAVLLIGAGLFRFAGVTGDLVPIFESRWKAAAHPSPEGVQAPVATVHGTAPPEPAATIRAGADFPQFLGRGRDGVIRGIRLVLDWEAQPPTSLWRQPVGEGWGGFAITGQRALTQEQHGEEERVTCYDLLTGKPLWAHGCRARYDTAVGGVGPRATPTVQSNRVYALGATGHLTCLDLASGALIWSVDVLGPVTSDDVEWGVSSSPLLWNDLAIVAPRGGTHSLYAFHASTGELAWKSGALSPHYSSPQLETLLGVPQILIFTEATAAAHDPSEGRLLWEYPWRRGHPHVTDPRAVGTNRVLISSGYGTGSHLIELTREADGSWAPPRSVWRSIRLKSKFANIILHNGFAYGLDDGRLVCIDLGNGSRRWQGERYGHGQMLLVGEVILLTAENGAIVLIDASPEASREFTRFKAFDGKTWNPPALSGDILVVRTDREAAAYRLPTLQ
jgi:outer membrane protein assembly factor BamB